jgi:pimeloyl-CoA dehydrogenase small subunit
MDFDLSDDQRLLKDSVDRLIADRYTFEARRKIMAEPGGWSREMWAQFAELGLLGLPFPEALGGFGGGPVETMLVMEAFGRGLVLEPFLATVILGGGLVQAAGSAEQQKALLPAIAQGKKTLAFAHVERASRYNLADVQTTAKQQGGAWVLNGEKSVVIAGDTADTLIVTARTKGGRFDRDGIGLFLVDAKSAGVTVQGYPTQDGTHAAEIRFDNAKASGVLGDPAGGLAAAEKVMDQAIAAICAEAVGLMQEMHTTTVDYMKTRKQFGRAISEFQVLQHRSVDMFVSLEQARSMSMFATFSVSEPDDTARARSISAAKVQINNSGKHIGQECVQLHGGIAMTMEYKAGHYFKRMTMLEQLFGDTDTHQARVAASGSLF